MREVTLGELRKPGSEIRSTLASNIRDYRNRNNISQEKFAQICGLHRTYIGSVERGERNVTISTLEIIAEAIGITVPDLLSRKVS